MAKKIFAFLLALVLLTGTACNSTPPIAQTSTTIQKTPSATPSTTSLPTTTPDTSALYKTMNVGSSKKLQGTCVFITIFLSDGECSPFTEREKEIQFYSLRTAVYYLTKHAEKYNQCLSIIYNTEDTIIDYAVDYIIPRNCEETWPYFKLLLEIRSQYNIDDIMKKYNADNLSFIININKTGRSYGIQCLKNIAYNEAIMIYNYRGNEDGLSLEDISYGGSSDYAHELLHVFGAIDLYDLNDERLALAEQYFPNDIMLTGMLNFSTELEDSLGILDAYLIGWVDKLEEKYEIFLE